MTGASNLYIAHSTPSASAPGSRTASPRPTTPSLSSSASKNQGQSRGGDPLPENPASRTLLILQSPTTRKNLTQIHAISGSAAKLSSKAAATVESLIQRAIGSPNSSSSANKGKGIAASTPPSLPPRSRGPSPAPPDSKPLLPPRNAESARTRTPSPSGARVVRSPQPAPTGPLRKGTRVALSAALVLATIEASTVRLIEAGGAAVSAAVAHKYGATAGENAALAAHTARNIVLVYVDVRGLGRRVIVRRVAKAWAKGRIESARQEAAARK